MKIPLADLPQHELVDFMDIDFGPCTCKGSRYTICYTCVQEEREREEGQLNLVLIV